LVKRLFWYWPRQRCRLFVNIPIRPFHKIAKMEPGRERHGGYLGFT
jgi:hypothetical protein